MSNYNWCKGSVKLPAKDYRRVRDLILQAYNTQREDLYRRALKAYEVVKGLKVKRGTSKRDLILCEQTREDVLGRGSTLDRALPLNLSVDALEQIADALFPINYKDGKRTVRSTPLKPKKKDFGQANSRTTSIDLDDEAFVAFDNKAHTISFGCEENNRNQERFLESAMAKVIFSALASVKWTSRTGGSLIGNDEYNQGSDYESQGGNYVIYEWSKTSSPRRRASFSPRSGSHSAPWGGVARFAARGWR